MATSITIFGTGEFVTGEQTGHYCDKNSLEAHGQTEQGRHKTISINIFVI